jgi:hypothetical protein
VLKALLRVLPQQQVRQVQQALPQQRVQVPQQQALLLWAWPQSWC